MKMKAVVFFVSLLSLAACSWAVSGGIITDEQLAKSAAVCGHRSARVASIITSTGTNAKMLTVIEISSDTMQLTRIDKCLQKELRALGSNFQLKLVPSKPALEKRF
jgi:hypothetical protein